MARLGRAQPAPPRIQYPPRETPVGMLELSGAGYEIGDGNDPATMSVIAAGAFTVAVYADALPFGSALYSATGQASNASGNLADVVSASLVPGTTYIVSVRNEADGEVWIWRMAAT